MGKNGKIGHFYQEKKPIKALHVGKHQFLSTLCIYLELDIYLESSDEGGYHYFGGNLEHIELIGGDSTTNANKNHSTCWETSILSSILYICFFLSSMTDNLLLEG